MSARQSIINLNPKASACSKRHGLFYGFAVVAIAALVGGPAGLGAQRDIQVRIPSYMPPDFPATVNAIIPTPQYLPAGYELWKINRMPADGFGTGKAENEVQYRDPGCWARRTTCSLQLFVSPMTDRPFAGTTGRTPQSLSVRIGTRTVQAQYFTDTGIEWPEGGTIVKRDKGFTETGTFNALVFPFDRFMIAIRGNRTAGVGRAELIRMAKSLTYTAR